MVPGIPVSVATGTNTLVLDSWLYLVFLLVAAWLAAAPASLTVFITMRLLMYLAP